MRLFLLLLSLLTTPLFSQGIDITDRLWGTCKKPKMTELKINPPLSNDYLDDVKEITIDCGDNIKIIIHPSENRRNQLIEVTKKNEILYKFYTKGVFNHFNLSGAYKINLFQNKANTILLVAYPTGATGIAANMTWGILFDIEGGTYQQLSTWGMLDECFIDIDDNGIFEFVCVQYQWIGYDVGLVANVFTPDISGKYIINTSAETNNVFVLFIEYELNKPPIIKEINWKQSVVELLKIPDAFSGPDNYLKKRQTKK